MERLLYATPTGKHPHVAYVKSVRGMEVTCKTFEREPEDFIFAVGPVQMARSKIAELATNGRCFKKHDHEGGKSKDCKVEAYDYVLMHDDDLDVTPVGPLGNPIDHWHKMFQENPEVGVVGAVYLRERPLMPNVVMPHHAGSPEMCHVVSGLPDSAIEVGGIGTGFMMLRTSVFEAVFRAEEASGAPPMFKFGLRQLPSGMVVEDGEDYDFCRRVRSAGFKVIADPRFDTVHMKDTGALHYNRDNWEWMWSEKNPQIKDVVQDIRGQCPPAMELKTINKLLCIDHTAQRAIDEATWLKRQEAKKREAA